MPNVEGINRGEPGGPPPVGSHLMGGGIQRKHKGALDSELHARQKRCMENCLRHSPEPPLACLLQSFPARD